ncbi:ABC transporter permease [Bacillus massiliigorillae]|uniref:ABC transporter permease n=1 Tax=Bacillus massiliigorillae TaxID=1243664 RepID=UPI0003A5BBAE|nr:ABC transporter permease [Bacillus massiliigorillae]
MFARLAIGNAKRSIKDYLIYFITITLCVSFFYAFTSLSSSSYKFITEGSYNFEMLQNILKYSTYGITALLIILIGYVNQYMMRRRQREFATYILLGTEQKSVAFMFFIETLLIGIVSIILGIFIGTLFSQVVTALVLLTAKQEIVFSFRLYMDTVVITFLFFIAMFCIIGIFNIRVLNKKKLIDMLHADKKTEFQFKRSSKVYIITFMTSVMMYGVCGYCTYKLISIINHSGMIEISDRVYIPFALISFIIGTYALFYSLAYIIIFIKNRWLHFKYEYTNLFLIGSIVSKIKTAPILMATIAITFLGASLSFTLTLILSQWSLGYLDYRAPYDISISNEYAIASNIKDIPKIDYNDLTEYLHKEGYNIDEYRQVEKYFLQDEDFYQREKSSMPILAIGLSDFNKLRDMLGYDKVDLGENEFTMQWAKMASEAELKRYIKEHSTLKINGQHFTISSEPYFKESIGEGVYNYFTDALIVLPDAICKELTIASTDFLANTTKEISYEKASYFEKQIVPKWFELKHNDLLSKYDEELKSGERFYPIHTNMKVVEVSEILNATLAMRILGIYLGTVLLMISLTVLALQQLADSIEHKARFKTLTKLGIDHKEISKIILKQISIYFVLPISIAIIGYVLFISNYIQLYRQEINSYIGDQAFRLNVGISILLILGIYVVYFIATYYTFKRNVKDGFKR